MKTFVLRSDPDSARLYQFLKSNWRAMADAGTPLSVTVAQYKAKRSIEQNKLLHSVEREIADKAWVNGGQYSKDAWHAYFAEKFIGFEELPSGGRLYISTARLSVAEMSAYLLSVINCAEDELGIEIEAGRI